MEVPVYTKTESINSYISRVKKYHNFILKDKYEMVLKFINELLSTKYYSLFQFKNIEEINILKNEENNKNLIIKYNQIFKDQFGIDIKLSKKITNKSIIKFLKDVLSIINYSLKKTKVSNTILYSIRRN